MHDGGDWMFFGGGYMWIFWILLIVVIVVIVAGIAGEKPGSSKDTHEDSALEILKKRYARGEITRDQYQELLSDLA